MSAPSSTMPAIADMRQASRMSELEGEASIDLPPGDPSAMMSGANAHAQASSQQVDDDIEKTASPSCEEAGLGQPEQIKFSKGRLFLIGSACFFTNFVSTISSATVMLSIPSMAKYLEITTLSAQWTTSSWGVAFACGLLVSGRFADMFGRRLQLMVGLSIVIVLSFITGFMRHLVPICVLRGAAGFGMALASPSAFGILGTTFREEPARTVAFTLLGVGLPVGGSTGLLIGGATASAGRLGWSYCYFIIAGMAAIPLLLTIFFVPPQPVANIDKKASFKRIDWLGAFLIGCGIALFLFALTQSGVVSRGWKEPYVPTCLAIGLTMIVSFGFWVHHVEHHLAHRLQPILKLSLLTHGGWKVASVLVCAFCAYSGTAGWIVLVTVYYQDYHGYSPLKNAVHTMPSTVFGILASAAVLYLAPRVRAPYLLIMGGTFGAVANLFYAVEPNDLTFWAMEFPAQLLLPFATDMMTGVGSILMSNLVEEHEQSLAGGLFQTASQTAQPISVCISTYVQQQRASATGDLRTGLRAGFWLTSAWGFFSAILVAITLREVGLAKDVAEQFGIRRQRQPSATSRPDLPDSSAATAPQRTSAPLDSEIDGG